MAAVWFLLLLFLFQFEWKLNELHSNTGDGYALALQRVEAEHKAREAARQRRWAHVHPERVAERMRRAADEQRWEAESAVVRRGSGGAAARAERLEKRRN